MSSKIQEFWLGKLANLNVSRLSNLGIAPHKPLMILSVMDLIESNEIIDRSIHYNARLVTQFRDYWDLVVERRKNRPEITMPFNALGGEMDAIWERFDENGNPSKSKLTTRLCLLDETLLDCFLDPKFRQMARKILIANYFTAPEQVGLCSRLKIPLPNTTAITELKKDAATFKASQKKGRDSRFKSEVGPGYKYTCALTGYCLHTAEGYMVQAAHIHQHAKSGNDDPRNGLALTPDAHWMFDAGLWTMITKGDELLIHVATGRFTETSPHQHLLASFHLNPLQFHVHAKLRPDPKYFEWHRAHHRIVA